MTLVDESSSHPVTSLLRFGISGEFIHTNPNPTIDTSYNRITSFSNFKATNIFESPDGRIYLGGYLSSSDREKTFRGIREWCVKRVLCHQILGYDLRWVRLETVK